jgi:hypothetical protein
LSPAISVDLIFPPSSNHCDLVENNIYVTLYDVTHRYDYDARGWVEKLKGLLTSVSRDIASRPDKSASSATTDDSHSSLTRVFLSVADCNLDYISSPRFKTAARAILRVGDLRFSSNIVSPAAPTQAFSLSLGDVAVYLCNSRFPYSFENSRLVGSKTVMRPDEVSFESFKKSTKSNLSSESVLREMNYRTVLTLDSLDAVLAVSNAQTQLTPEPYLCLSLTVGEIGFFTCKDSFARFVGTLAEISAEMAALDDAAIEALKAIQTGDETFYDSVTQEEVEVEKTKDSQPLLALDELKPHSALRPKVGTDARNDCSKNFLLDGYDWTAIDKDEDNAMGIPWGEEQTARWHTTDKSPQARKDEADDTVEIIAGIGAHDTAFSRSPGPKVPPIITHHFSLHPVADPLGDGDMGSAKFAGLSTLPRVRTRVLVHDLSVKVRCFDGFDWPELLDEESRSLFRKGPFVISDNAPEKVRDAKKEETEAITDLLAGTSHAAKLERKAKLMGDLLGGHLLGGPSEPSSTFIDAPLPEEKGRSLKEQAELRRLARRTSKYFQLSSSGVTLRLDSMEDSTEHRLASCIHLKAQDLFVAETISSDRPVKMAGEWVNEQDHPRDTRDGLIAIKVSSFLFEVW